MTSLFVFGKMKSKFMRECLYYSISHNPVRKTHSCVTVLAKMSGNVASVNKCQIEGTFMSAINRTMPEARA